MKGLLLLLCIFGLSFGDHFLETEQYYYGPFTYPPLTNKFIGWKKDASSDPVIPIPALPFAVKSWGEWEVVDAKTHEKLPENHMFIHHVMLYGLWGGDRQFLSGASQDKKTWGPNLPDGYLVRVPSDMVQQVFLHLVNLQNKTVDVLVRYKIRYYKMDHVPQSTVWVKCVDLQNSLPILAINSSKEPIFTQHFTVNNRNGPLRIVTAQGHMHQGGIDITIANNATGEQWCTSKAHYSKKFKCYFKDWCPRCTTGDPLTWDVYDTITFCPLLDFRLESGQKYEIIARYDNKCPYDSVMAWFFLYVATDADNPK
jgi:hypothetical protein